MRLWMTEPGLRESWPGVQHGGAAIQRWSTDPGGLSPEECARKGIEALAGLVIFGDVLEISDYTDEMFCACVELHHAVTGTSGGVGDYIGAYFRAVEFKDATYPMAGPRSFKMLMQPLSDGRVLARWNAVDSGGEADEPEGGGPMVDDVSTRIGVGTPLALDAIPEQEEDEAGLPSFLLLRDPGAGWQIWRRFTPESAVSDVDRKESSRDETYTMVFPMMDSNFNWQFRVYDVPGGGVRVEMNRGNRG